MLVRELAVSLGLTTDEASFAKGQLLADGIKLALGYVATAATEMAASFAVAAKSFVGDLLALDEAAGELDVTAESLQALEVSAIAAGASTDALRKGLAHLKKDGVSNVDAAFLRLADRIAALPEGVKRTEAATKALGKSGESLVPFLQRGSGAIREMTETIGPFQAAVNDLVRRYKTWVKENDEALRRRLTFIVGALAVAVGTVAGYLARGLSATLKAIDDAWAYVHPFFTRWGESLKYIGRMLLDIARTLYDRVGAAFAYVFDKAKSAFAFLVDNFQKVKDFIGQNGLALAVGALAVAFEYLGYAGTISALKTAASWALTLAEFVAIAAVLAAIYLAFDDVATYQESIRRGGTGKNTIYGKWKIQIDEMIEKFKSFIADWMKPNGDDPWWLKAVKSLVRYLDRAYGIAEKLHLSTGPAREADANGLGAKALRAAGVTDPAWVGRLPGSTLTRDDELPEYARPGYKGAAPQPSFFDRLIGGSAYGSPQPATTPAPIPAQMVQQTFHVTQLPSEDGEKFAQRVAAIADEQLNARLEEASAPYAGAQ